MTRFRLLPLLAVLALATPALAQTPTPTPTPSGTPTPTPTPPAGYDLTLAGTTRYPIPNGSRYDGAKLVLDSDGSVWGTSGIENAVAKLSSDGTKVTRWTFPKDATPSSLLKDPDGNFWVTELGGFNVAKFEPASGNLTEWSDFYRRPSSLARRPDGKFWLPETGGALALFDPAAGQFTYYTGTGIYALSYPLLEPDGTLYTCDFLVAAILRFTPDGSKATIWRLPNAVSGPSKIFRGPDGFLWISLYTTGELARFDPATGEIRTFALGFGDLPFDLAIYRDLILYSDQRNGFIGVFDPKVVTPTLTQTLASTEVTTTATVKVVPGRTTNITPTTDDVSAVAASGITGYRVPGLTQFAAGVVPVWGITVDEKRARIYYGTTSNIGTLLPPVPATTDQHFPSAASIGGLQGSRWKTQLVTWNRGTPDTANVAHALIFYERLLPNGWIAGYLPAATQSLDPNKMLAQADPIGSEMKGPDSFGGLQVATTAPDDLFAWARFYTTRPDGGTYGFARNAARPDLAIGPGQTGFVFTPPDAASQRTNAGYLVIQAARGTIALVDKDGVSRASVAFDYPAGYHFQGSSIFKYFGLEPIADARVVVSVTTGKVLPFGVSVDNATNDPIELAALGPRNAATGQAFLGLARAAGPMGPSTRTDLQLFNGGTADATVQFVFRPATPVGTVGSSAPSGATVSVPAGKVVSLRDVLGTTLGLSTASGTLEVLSDVPVHAFARVTASAESGGRYGFGVAGQQVADAVPSGSRGVFLATTDNGFFSTQSDLYLMNLSDAPATVTLNFTTVDGVAAATRDVTVPAKATQFIETVWYTTTGFGTDFGRLDVVPATGSGPVLPVLLRQDRKTGDVDALQAFVSK